MADGRVDEEEEEEEEEEEDDDDDDEEDTATPVPVPAACPRCCRWRAGLLSLPSDGPGGSPRGMLAYRATHVINVSMRKPSSITAKGRAAACAREYLDRPREPTAGCVSCRARVD